jgi:hypothetical protein
MNDDCENVNENNLNTNNFSFPLPETLAVKVYVKIGQEFSVCRTVHCTFNLNVVISEGEHVLRAKIKAKLLTMSEIIWDDVSGNILFPPTVNEIQRNYTPLSKDPNEFKEQLQKLWHRVGKRIGFVHFNSNRVINIYYVTHLLLIM